MIEAPTLFARLERLVRDGAAYVALPAGTGRWPRSQWHGNASERLVDPRPLVAWSDPWREIFTELAEGLYMEAGIDLFTWVDDVEEAVEAIRARVPRSGEAD